MISNSRRDYVLGMPEDVPMVERADRARCLLAAERGGR